MYVHACDLPKPNIGTFYRISRVGEDRSWKKQLNNTDIWQIIPPGGPTKNITEKIGQRADHALLGYVS